MKALYIYNPHNAKEVSLIDRAKSEMATYINVYSVEELPVMLRYYIRTTPALIIVTDDLQGENLISEDIDGKLLATAMLYKRLEEEELIIHNQETNRLDNLIRIEKEKAVFEEYQKLVDTGKLSSTDIPEDYKTILEK